MVKINKAECIGCGLCASICEEVFEMKDGKAYVKADCKKNAKCIKDAIESCPVNAISN